MQKDEKTRKPLYAAAEGTETSTAGQSACLSEREEFICLLKQNPDLCPVLLRILAPQEQPHEVPETPHHSA